MAKYDEMSREELIKELKRLSVNENSHSDEDPNRRENMDETYRLLFNGMPAGYALHEIICDSDGKPCNYRFLDVNPAFESITGLQREDITGKTVIEVLPQIEKYWIETYGDVALSGKSIRFEHYSCAMDKYLKYRLTVTGKGNLPFYS